MKLPSSKKSTFKEELMSCDYTINNTWISLKLTVYALVYNGKVFKSFLR